MSYVTLSLPDIMLPKLLLLNWKLLLLILLLLSSSLSPSQLVSLYSLYLGGKWNTVSCVSNVGPRAVYLLGELAELEQSLLHFTTTMMKENGFYLIASPEIFRTVVVVGWHFSVCQWWWIICKRRNGFQPGIYFWRHYMKFLGIFELKNRAVRGG